MFTVLVLVPGPKLPAETATDDLGIERIENVVDLATEPCFDRLGPVDLESKLRNL